MSHAHFLNGDASLYDRIEGLKPDNEKHGSQFVFDQVRFISATHLFVSGLGVFCKTSLFLFPTLIPLSVVGTTCFHNVVIKIRQLFLRRA
jgi:hypothetical protein